MSNLPLMKSPFKRLRQAWIEFSRVAFGINHIAEFDVTDNCDSHCAHCYHFQKTEGFRHEEVPLSEWRRRFETLVDRRINTVLMVGGEPALRPDILELADQYFPSIYVITNGLTKIDDSFRHTLFVSLDGLELTNDSLRGEGTFRRVIENYAGDRRAIINMTLLERNYLELEKVMKVAVENKFRGLVCNLYAHTRRDDAFRQYVLEPATREKVIEEMRRVKKAYPKRFFFTKTMLDWYEKADHLEKCFWRERTLHFNVDFRERKCFSDDVDCSDCGCFAGSVSDILDKPRERFEFCLMVLLNTLRL